MAAVKPIEQAIQDEIAAQVKTYDIQTKPDFSNEVLQTAGELTTLRTLCVNLINTAYPNVSTVFCVLDFVLSVNSEQHETFFNLLENVANILPVSEFDSLFTFLEHRVYLTTGINNGVNTVVFLRTLKSVYARLNPSIHSQFIGRLLTLHALNKGFAHSSRLNKRGKKFYEINSEPLPNLDIDYTNESQFTIGFVFKCLQVLPELTRSPYFSKFLVSLTERLDSLKQEKGNTRSSPKPSPKGNPNAITELDTDQFGLKWSDLHDSDCNCTYVLFICMMTTMALHFVDQTEETKNLNDNASILLTMKTKNSIRWFGSLNTKWTQWKQNQCPDIKGPRHENFHIENSQPPSRNPNTALLSPDLPDILQNIGNPTLTESLKDSLELSDFNIQPSDLESEYKSLRTQSFKQLVEEFKSKNIEMPDLSHLESELASKTKRPAEDRHTAEPTPKRARISYEDAETNRRKAIQATARPLPY